MVGFSPRRRQAPDEITSCWRIGQGCASLVTVQGVRHGPQPSSINRINQNHRSQPGALAGPAINVSIASGKTSQIPAFRVAPLWEQIKRYRRAALTKVPPADVQGLVSLFRSVRLAEGYSLGCIRVGSRERGWIWPYAVREAAGAAPAPPKKLAEIPVDRLASGRLDDNLRPLILETLNRHLVWDRTPQGLLEYALLVRELWSMKSESQEADWLSIDFVLTRHSLHQILRRAGRATIRSSLDDSLDPRAVLSYGGGRVILLGHLEMPWQRVLEITLRVDRDGWVSWESGQVVLNLAD